MAIMKDAFYFPHFSGARNDRKIKRLRKELHAEGYGIYFMILEILRDQADFSFPMDDLDLLADDLNTSEQKVRVVICNYGLFEVNDSNCFWSPKFVQYLQPYLEKSARGKEAARARWEKEKIKQIGNQQSNNAFAYANAYANALQMQCGGNADAMQREERKEKKEKRREEVEEKTNPTTPKIFLNETLKSIDVLMTDALSDKINFVEHVMRENKMTEFQISGALSSFVNFLKSGGELVKTSKDFRFHFQNWLKKQDKTLFRINPTLNGKQLTNIPNAKDVIEKYK